MGSFLPKNVTNVSFFAYFFGRKTLTLGEQPLQGQNELGLGLRAITLILVILAKKTIFGHVFWQKTAHFWRDMKKLIADSESKIYA